MLKFLAIFLSIISMQAYAQTLPDDPFIYMEEVQGDKALTWVKAQNTITRELLEAAPQFKENRAKVLGVLDNRDRIPAVSRRGDYLYNLLKDKQYAFGLWRRTTLAEYRKPSPAWEPILDLDALSKTENESWVFHGATCSPPSWSRCLLSLSRGGSDAHVVREFDIETRTFVKDGFALPEAKSRVTWVSDNAILVTTDFGAGTMTASGYPRLVKLWQRGTPLTKAITLFEAKVEDVSAYAFADKFVNAMGDLSVRIVVGASTDFYNSQNYLVTDDGVKSGKPQLKKLDVPTDSGLTFNRDWAFLSLRSPLKNNLTPTSTALWPAGTLLVTKADKLIAGKPEFQALFTPTSTVSLARDGDLTILRDGVILQMQDNVAGRLEEWRPPTNRQHAGSWYKRGVSAPNPGAISVSSWYDPFVQLDKKAKSVTVAIADDPLANAYALNYEDFLTPSSLFLGKLGTDERELLKRNPVFFNADGMRSEQRFAKSKDGTQIPYFVVYPSNYKGGGSNPVLLYGYGGFQISQGPWYSGGWGQTWYERGGVLVVANIRGGGEFGPTWHQAAIKENKQKSYDDFIAVGEDLIANGITKPASLGIMGGSNGGLLVGAVMVQRPDLFGAVVCSVPLLDMRRYHTLLAGNSWMAEYGNPDKPEEWAWISKYSPYQNVKAGVKYPRVLFTTSTKDDRVHPAHARKMAARMMAQGRGSSDVLYYENIAGGHAGAANNQQRADLVALEITFLWEALSQ